MLYGDGAALFIPFYGTAALCLYLLLLPALLAFTPKIRRKFRYLTFSMQVSKPKLCPSLNQSIRFIITGKSWTLLPSAAMIRVLACGDFFQPPSVWAASNAPNGFRKSFY